MCSDRESGSVAVHNQVMHGTAIASSTPMLSFFKGTCGLAIIILMVCIPCLNASVKNGGNRSSHPAKKSWKKKAKDWLNPHGVRKQKYLDIAKTRTLTTPYWSRIKQDWYAAKHINKELSALKLWVSWDKRDSHDYEGQREGEWIPSLFRFSKNERRYGMPLLVGILGGLAFHETFSNHILDFSHTLNIPDMPLAVISTLAVTALIHGSSNAIANRVTPLLKSIEWNAKSSSRTQTLVEHALTKTFDLDNRRAPSQVGFEIRGTDLYNLQQLLKKHERQRIRTF